jgi:hypothetical protein
MFTGPVGPLSASRWLSGPGSELAPVAIGGAGGYRQLDPLAGEPIHCNLGWRRRVTPRLFCQGGHKIIDSRPTIEFTKEGVLLRSGWRKKMIAWSRFDRFAVPTPPVWGSRRAHRYD